MFLLKSWFAAASLLVLVIADEPFPRTLVDVNDPIFRDNGVNYHLPNNTHPETYDLSLWTRVDAEDFDYVGTVKIGIVVDEPTREIFLHYRQLIVTNVTLTRLNGSAQTNIPILPYTYDLVPEFLQIATNEIDLNAGDRLILEINYFGTLSNDLRGFYRSSYINSQGTKTWLAATHFEPTNARRLLPCYDEPARKAKFTIRVTHGKHYTAISNMPETRIENSDDTATTSFLETPPTSSYLLALVVSDFPYRSNTNSSGEFRQRIYAQPSKIDETTLGLKDGVRILKALEDYLQVEYSLPKMDQVAVPDFGPGAMENWGLVLYKEDYLLWNQAKDYFTQKFYAVTTISHEFAHQFFGNYISPRWWTYIWLNEGFANLFEQIGTDLVYPEWNIFDYYVTNNVQGVLKSDANPSTRQMSFYAQSPAAISKLFDNIAYAKSGSVLRMFLHAFSEKSFKKGLNYYLKSNAFKAVDENDLFESLNQAVREDGTLDRDLTVSDIFSSWSNQRGYPLLVVKRKYNTNVITLAQHRYFSRETDANDTATWWLPFNYATSHKPNFNETIPNGWIKQGRKMKLVHLKLSDNDWIIFNKQQTSLYRVLYDEANYKLIAKQLNGDNFGVIHKLSRSQLLDDLNEFVNVDRVPANILLDFLSYLKQETEYAPWKSASDALFTLDRMLPAVKEYRKFRTFAANLTEKFFNSLGIEDSQDETILRKFARNIAINLACTFALPACLNATHQKLSQVIRNNVELSPNTQTIIYNHGVRKATAEDLEILWARLVQSTNIAERLLIASSLGNIRSLTLLNKYLNKSIENNANNTLTYVWGPALLRSACANGQHGVLACIRFLQAHSSDVLGKYALENLNIYVVTISQYVVADKVQEEFNELLTTLLSKDQIRDNYATAAKRQIEANLEWINKRREAIEKWLTPLEANTTAPADDGNSAHAIISSVYLLLTAILVSLNFK